MEFLELTKKLLKLKKENRQIIYSTNPFTKSKQVKFIWIEPDNKSEK